MWGFEPPPGTNKINELAAYYLWLLNSNPSRVNCVSSEAQKWHRFVSSHPASGMFGLPAWVFQLKLNILLTVSMQTGGLEPLNLKWIVVLPAFLRPARVDIFLRQFGRGSPHLTGTASALMGALLSGLLRWMGTGTKVASMICPLFICTPRSMACQWGQARLMHGDLVMLLCCCIHKRIFQTVINAFDTKIDTFPQTSAGFQFRIDASSVDRCRVGRRN